jgi:hypothetical protein
MKKKPAKKTQHCIYCSQEIKVSRKGYLSPHINVAQQCVGGGQVAAQMAAFLDLKKEK